MSKFRWQSPVGTDSFLEFWQYKIVSYTVNQISFLMTKMLTFRGLLLAILFAAASPMSFAQTPFWTETFSDETTSLTNWEQGGDNSGPSIWAWTDVLNAGGFLPGDFVSPTSSTGYMWFDSDANGQGFPYDVTLTGIAVPANCVGKSNLHLKFNTYFRTYTGTDIASVGISTDGTNFTYHDVPQFDALVQETTGNPQVYQGEIDLEIPEADNKAQVWVQFRYSGEFEYYWKVDDVSMYEGAPAAPVNVTFRVNMALQTIDPAGAFLAGSFNNWNGEAMTNEGNGIWSLTKALTEGETYQYKYKNGPNGWEQAPAACGVNDGNGGFNRFITPTVDVALPAVCFASCVACALPCNLNPNSIICDNFDTYSTTMKLGPQATWWSTWSGTEGTTEDGIVTTEQKHTAPNSVKINSTATAGGPQDVVLKLGNKTSGNYELKWQMFIPVGKNGYYNIQNVVPIVAGDWNLDVFFENAGAGRIQIGAGAVLANFSYPNGQWFEVRQKIDLDNNFLTLWINDNYVAKIPYAKNLGGIDFYGTNNISTYYIDDVEYIGLPPVVYNVDVCDSAVDLTSYFGAAPGVAQTTGLYNNTTATAAATDPDVTCWGETTGADIVDGSMWYTFTGDGNLYHIETVPCNATNYIGTAQQDPGDTQMLVYAGDNCDDLTEVICNDDLYADGMPDWRAGLDVQTIAGQNYFMLVDGFNFAGTVALGQFCVEIKQVASVTCADAAVGTFEVPNPFLCFEAQLADLIQLDEASFILPNEGPIAGLAWAVSSAPVPAGTWPSDVSGYLGSTGFLDAPFAVGYQNIGPDAQGFPFGVYYATPVVLGGGTIIDPALAVSIGNVDPSAGCYFVGQSAQVFFLPLLDDISATVVTSSGAVNLTPAGGLGALLADDSYYTYQWSNGAVTQDLTGVAAGTYTCVVSDQSGCALEAVVTAQVTVGTKDPSTVQALTVSPNPTSGTVMLKLALASASDVRIEVLNTLGQTIQNINAGKVTSLHQAVELGNLAQGSYFLRVTVDGETAIRRVVLQH